MNDFEKDLIITALIIGGSWILAVILIGIGAF